MVYCITRQKQIIIRGKIVKKYTACRTPNKNPTQVLSISTQNIFNIYFCVFYFINPVFLCYYLFVKIIRNWINNMKKYFEKISSDLSLVELYAKIHEFEVAQNGHAYHDYNHVMNVASYCETILKSLNFNGGIIYEAKIAALLHDTGALQGKDDHAQRSFEYAKKYFEENKVQLKHKEWVLDAIKNHGDGFDTDNIIQLVLILADKIDIKKSRVSEFGKHVEGIRQCQYIDDIQFKIINNDFQINFVCDEKINLEEFNNYYFTKKIFKAISAFCKKLVLTPKVCVNNEPWSEFYKFISVQR